MAKYGVQVIGRGRQCFVVANIPGDSGYRKGPMPEDEALALARQMALELTALTASKPKDVLDPATFHAEHSNLVGAVIALLLAVAFLAGAMWRWLM